MSSSRVHITFTGAPSSFESSAASMREVALRLAAEAAAEQRDVDGDVVLGNAERLGDVFARAAGALHRRPDLALAALTSATAPPAAPSRRARGAAGSTRPSITLSAPFSAASTSPSLRTTLPGLRAASSSSAR